LSSSVIVSPTSEVRPPKCELPQAVMPRTFKEPANVASAWRVFPTEGGENLATSGRFWSVIGRLKVGLTPATVQPELATIAARYSHRRMSRFTADGTLRPLPLREALVGNYRDGLLLVIGAALLVLLVTAPTSPDSSSSAPRRASEISPCASPSGEPWAIARDQLVESLVLVVLGGAGRCGAGPMGPRSSARQPLRRLDSAQRRNRRQHAVLAVTGAVAVLTGLAFGIYHRVARHQGRLPSTRCAMAPGLRRSADGARRNALVAGQNRAHVVLLVCAGSS